MFARFFPWISVLTVFLFACGESEQALSRPMPSHEPWGGDCETLSAPEVLATAPSALDEISGMVMSREHCSVAWVHQDSGDGASIYALDLRDGRLLSTVTLRGVEARDWEAISMSECEEGWCIFVGDIGDNLSVHEDIAIHRFVEPDPFAASKYTLTPTTMRATLEHGPADAEALFSDGEELYILTKRGGRSKLYHATFEEKADGRFLQQTEIVWSEKVPMGGLANITAADYQSGPPRLVIRAYLMMFEFVGDEGDSMVELLAREPRSLRAGKDAQSEAVAYGRGGIYQVAEKVGAPVQFSGCEAMPLPMCIAPPPPSE